jgi:hypothetical protein
MVEQDGKDPLFTSHLDLKGARNHLDAAPKVFFSPSLL